MTTVKHTIMAGAVALAMLGSGVAQATVITFEGGLDPAFTYGGVSVTSVPVTAVSGYNNVAAATSSSYVAFNPWATSPSDFFIAGPATTTFTLNSFVIAGAWGTQTLGIEGWNNGSLLFSNSLAVSLSPVTFSPGWTSIDQLRILIGSDFVQDTTLSGMGQHWALDNLTINASPVPEPETYAMLMVGLGLLGFSSRRRKQKETAAA